MTVIEWVLALAGAVILFLGFVVRSRGRQLKAYDTLHNNDTRLHVSDQELIAASEKLCKELEVLLEKTQTQLEIHRGQNENFERQRTQVWQLYRTAGLQMGNAQGMLLHELQRLTKALNVYRLKLGEDPVKVDSAILATVSQFREEHGSERPDKLVAAHGQ